jgi:peptidoglycan/xylan/chitin deacetylase (PgdA/CDA1 family)
MRLHGVPVLLFHGLWIDPAQLRGRSIAEARYWLEARVFEKQMRGLASHGYTGVTLSELLAPHTPATTKPIVLTFDDGWSSDWRIATPILQQLGWKAEFFVTTEWMGRPGFMTWPEVREAAAAGMGIQSHSLSHPDMDTASLAHIRHEIVASKTVLEHQIGQPVDFFALPGGSGRQRDVAALAREAGYRGVCTSDVGLNSPEKNPFCWKRIPVVNTTSLSQLVAWGEGRGLAALLWKRSAFRFARRLFGSTLYEWSKTRIMRPTPTINEATISSREV